MNRIILIFILLVFVIFFSCEEQGIFINNCTDCLADEPLKTELEVKIDASSYSGVLIQIWEGNLEDSILLGQFREFSTTFTHEVTLNKKYTLTATYNIQDNTYVVVDSATPRVRFDKDKCDDPCYLVYDKKLDLSLKGIN
jgi:hypothetical protein